MRAWSNLWNKALRRGHLAQNTAGSLQRHRARFVVWRTAAPNL